MKTKLTFAATLAVLAMAAGMGNGQAAPLKKLKLPILVDQHYKLKHPSGPVTTVAPEKLRKGLELRTAPRFDPPRQPRPRARGF